MDEVFDRYYNLTLRFLSFRPRSEKEVKDYLEKKFRKSPNENLVSLILKKLKEKNFLNDLEFAKWWIENRKKGIRLIKLELFGKGISKETIEEACSMFDIVGKENRLLEKLIDKKKNLTYEKLIAYLLRRGFDYDTIRGALKKTDR